MRRSRVSTLNSAGIKTVEGGNVDRENGIIKNVSVITMGEALGHANWIDEVFLEQVVECGKDTPKGFKARYTHPGLSADGLAKYIGRVRPPFRREGNQVLGDLHLSKLVASSSPDGDLYEHVLNYAEEDPEAFGLSIVYYPDHGAEGRFQADHMDEDGDFKSPDSENNNNFPHARLADLEAVDMVGDPAANEKGLFSRGNILADEADRLTKYALGITEEQPEVTCFDADPGKVREWLQTYLKRNHLQVIDMEENQMTKEPETKIAELSAELKEVDYSALEDKAEARGFEAGRKAELERLNEFKSEFGEKPEFIIEQFEKGSSIEEARNAFAALRITELEKENEELKKNQPEELSGAGAVNFDDSSNATKPSSPAEKAARARELAQSEGISYVEALKRLS